MGKIAVEDVDIGVVDFFDSWVVLHYLLDFEVVTDLTLDIGLVGHLPDVEGTLAVDPTVLPYVVLLVKSVSFGVVHHKIDELVEV